MLVMVVTLGWYPRDRHAASRKKAREYVKTQISIGLMWRNA
jgi:hypothetical protein